MTGKPPTEHRLADGCPYHQLDENAYWSKAVAARAPDEVDAVVGAPFKIARTDRIASAGSCFAQHLARRLSAQGYNYLVAEQGYPRMGAPLMVKYNYGTFSARYGNIYTPLHLLQLFTRAYGTFEPREPFWRSGPNWIDPFRPFIQPKGFASLQEAELDRTQHLAAVRRMFETLDVFIFTFGLTEGWLCRTDEAALPVCPGCGAGTFDPQKYAFRNFTFESIVSDFAAFAGLLRSVNPESKIILTVSPVPLVATFSGTHVLPATAYSKAVLRVAAERLAATLAECAYFPSYEIVTAPFSRGAYFASDLRSVTQQGVDHVMRIFFRHFTDGDVALLRDISAEHAAPVNEHPQNLLDVICEEYASLAAARREA